MFGRKTLDQILSGFDTLKTELAGHISNQRDEIIHKQQVVANMTAEIQEHTESASRAQRVLDNIHSLLAQ